MTGHPLGWRFRKVDADVFGSLKGGNNTFEHVKERIVMYVNDHVNARFSYKK